MKRFIYLLVGFVFFSTPGWANHSNYGITPNYTWNINQSQSFIFMENGIEFSVFQDGQFDFFIPNYGPNVNVGFNNANINFSFNTGFNYNPFVQYDSFGAIIQIENTPIFYDHFGRVNQIGNVPIFYNNFGFVNRVGGLQIFYRNNVFWRQRGFINRWNRRYVWRPWHRFYAIPPAQFCLLSVHPYRQFYSPVRHIYYRPYRNNVRDFNFNRNNPNLRPRANRSNQLYAQTPRTRAERQIRSNVERRNREITRTRSTRLASADRSNTRRSVETRSNSSRNVEARNNSRRSVETRSSSRALNETRNRTRTNATPTSRTRSNERVAQVNNRRNHSASRAENNSRQNDRVQSNNRRANEVSPRTSNRRDNVSQNRATRKPSVTRNRSTSNKTSRATRSSQNNRSSTTRSSRSRS